MTGSRDCSRPYRLLLLPGDGVGPEVLDAVMPVVEALASQVPLCCRRADIGGASIGQTGQPLTCDVLKKSRRADAILLGAVGDPRHDSLPPAKRPEAALLTLRRELNLFANLRPIRVFPALSHVSPLKSSVLRDGVDILVVRELTGGLYYGQHSLRGEGAEAHASDTMVYRRSEIQRILRRGFELARKRRKMLTSVDKANVLACSRLWRTAAKKMAAEYPQVQVEHMYVDNCAMQMVMNPGQFDVLVTANSFGDILSDLGAAIAGSIGMLPSASIGSRQGPHLYEPVHGSAPDIAGSQTANPIAAILSVGMMMRLSLRRPDLARKLTDAVKGVLRDGYMTPDLSPAAAVSTAQLGEAVARAFLAGIT